MGENRVIVPEIKITFIIKKNIDILVSAAEAVLAIKKHDGLNSIKIAKNEIKDIIKVKRSLEKILVKLLVKKEDYSILFHHKQNLIDH